MIKIGDSFIAKVRTGYYLGQVKEQTTDGRFVLNWLTGYGSIYWHEAEMLDRISCGYWEKATKLHKLLAGVE